MLTILSWQATFLIELELSYKLLQQQVEDTEAKNESLRRIAFIQSHEIRNPLTQIMGLGNLITDGIHPVDENWLKMIGNATSSLDKVIHAIVTETMAAKDLEVIRFNKMVEEIEDYAILLLDRNGNVENWNKGAEKLKGYKASEIIGKNFSLFYTEEDKARNRPAYLIELAAKNGTARDEGWRIKKDGSRFWGSIVITAIHNDKNEIIGFTKVTRDLSHKLSKEVIAS